jgi:ribosomal protein S8
MRKDDSTLCVKDTKGVKRKLNGLNCEAMKTIPFCSLTFLYITGKIVSLKESSKERERPRLGSGALLATTVANRFGNNPTTPIPSTPNSGSSGQVNNPVRPMRRRDEDSDSDSNGEREGGRKPTEAELDNFRNNIFFNTTKAETERILKKLESEGIDTSEMRKFAEEQRNRGVRNLTAEEIKVKNLEKELAKLQKDLDNASKLATDTISIPTTLSDADVNPMAYIVREQKRLEDLKRAKEAELNKIKNDPIYKKIVENANRNAELQIQLDRKKNDDREIIELDKIKKEREDAYKKLGDIGYDSLTNREKGILNFMPLVDVNGEKEKRLNKGNGGDSTFWNKFLQTGKFTYDLFAGRTENLSKDLNKIFSGDASTISNKENIENTKNNNSEAYTSIQDRRDYYNWVDSKLEGKSKWFEAAAIVTKLNSVGSADGFNLWFLDDATENFLRDGNKYLFKYNMETANDLMNGTLNRKFENPNGKEISLNGLSGKALDYALVEYEQTKVQDFIEKYKKENPNADMKQMIRKASEATTLGAAPEYEVDIIKKHFIEKNIAFDFSNYEHRIMLGQRLIDKLYKK